jgi:hypothetical protein
MLCVTSILYRVLSFDHNSDHIQEIEGSAPSGSDERSPAHSSDHGTTRLQHHPGK